MIISKGYSASATVDPLVAAFKKSLEKQSDPQNSVQTESHIELPYVVISPVQLNISALSDPHLLFISLTFELKTIS